MEKENTESIPKPQLISEAMQAADSSSDEVHSPGKVEGKPCLKMVTAETSPRNAQELDFSSEVESTSAVVSDSATTPPNTKKPEIPVGWTRDSITPLQNRSASRPTNTTTVQRPAYIQNHLTSNQNGSVPNENIFAQQPQPSIQQFAMRKQPWGPSGRPHTPQVMPVPSIRPSTSTSEKVVRNTSTPQIMQQHSYQPTRQYQDTPNFPCQLFDNNTDSMNITRSSRQTHTLKIGYVIKLLNTTMISKINCKSLLLWGICLIKR
eukprot:TRINITY_DN31_c0_g1_i5.p1 TRINITY_DN31_c0_g1~~TRINITY_DN31_c0_g1_i5.p1  ORF type:complete len:263 (-),score=24.27 TRINITY_DN31_c0_g1_i5:946-1734(-)